MTNTPGLQTQPQATSGSKRANRAQKGQFKMNSLVQKQYEEADYHEKTALFMERTKTELNVEFLRHDVHFDDGYKRDIYQVTLKCGARAYSFEFGQSAVHSGVWTAYRHIKGDERIYQSSKNISLFNEEALKTVEQLNKTGRKSKQVFARQSNIGKNPDFQEPDAYTVLAALTNYAPESLEVFCGDYGYDTDSRKAEKTYNAVKDEVMNLERLYSKEQMEELAEIQ